MGRFPVSGSTPTLAPLGQRWVLSARDNSMREVVFEVLTERPGHLEAQAAELPRCIAAASLEELQHEAREALIEHFGPAHCAYRVRIRRPRPALRCPSLAHSPVLASATHR
jgi:hypothetical protein